VFALRRYISAFMNSADRLCCIGVLMHPLLVKIVTIKHCVRYQSLLLERFYRGCSRRVRRRPPSCPMVGNFYITRRAKTASFSLSHLSSVPCSCCPSSFLFTSSCTSFGYILVLPPRPELYPVLQFFRVLSTFDRAPLVIGYSDSNVH
jgi:hypothetical protein